MKPNGHSKKPRVEPEEEARPEEEELLIPDPASLDFSTMEKFVVYRTEDVSGMSGTGIVGEGCQFSSGWCALTWVSNYLKLEWVPSIAVIERVHGHGGKTVVLFENDHSHKEHKEH